MSVRVEPTRLAEHASARPFAYVITLRPADPRSGAHIVSLPVDVNGATVVCHQVGESTRRNIDADSAVTLVWPPHHDAGEYGAYTLIADGRGAVRDSQVTVEVVSAILHRPAV